MLNYKILNSCGNCQNCVITDMDYSDPEYYYCNGYKDMPIVTGLRSWSDDLSKWKQSHEVSKNGYCDLFKKKE